MSPPNLDRLLVLPSGCGEQNLVRTATNWVVAEYLQTTEQLQDFTAVKIRNNIQTGKYFNKYMGVQIAYIFLWKVFVMSTSFPFCYQISPQATSVSWLTCKALAVSVFGLEAAAACGMYWSKQFIMWMLTEYALVFCLIKLYIYIGIKICYQVDCCCSKHLLRYCQLLQR